MLCRLSTGWANEMPEPGRLKEDEVEEGIELSAVCMAFPYNLLESGGWSLLKCASQGLLSHLSMTLFSLKAEQTLPPCGNELGKERILVGSTLVVG